MFNSLQKRVEALEDRVFTQSRAWHKIQEEMELWLHCIDGEGHDDVYVKSIYTNDYGTVTADFHVFACKSCQRRRKYITSELTTVQKAALETLGVQP